MDTRPISVPMMTQRHAPEHPVAAAPPSWRGDWLFIVAIVVASLPLVFNPGYFSHDELQWLAFADRDAWTSLPWQGWLAFDTFQFRPLTFNSWLMLSKLFGYQPFVMHAVVVALGLLNAWLLRRCLVAASVAPLPASVAALLFVLSPHVVQVHGWVGTLGDLYCLMAGLLMIRTLQRRPSIALELPAIAALMVIALWAKESAVVLPALLLVLWRWRGRSLLPPIAIGAVVVLGYLVLRFDTLVTPPVTATAYAWQFGNIPARVVEYLAWPFLPGVREVHLLSIAPWPLLAAGLAAAALLVATVAVANWHAALLLVAGWIASLTPVLVLGAAQAVYGYLASAWVIAIGAWTFRDLPWRGRLVIAVLAMLVIAHGVTIVRHVRHVGVIQSGLYGSLAPLLANATPQAPIRVVAERARDQFALQRLLHEVPSWRRMAVADRVFVVPFGDPRVGDPPVDATHRMDENGRLTPIAASPMSPSPH